MTQMSATAITPTATTPTASVIVPARNEAAHIEACLGSLAAQQNLSDLEIIVVDNGSTDTTAQLVQVFAKAHSEVNIRLVTEPKPGRGAARAAGFAAARGQLLLSTDADTVVPPEWAAVLMAALHEPNTAAVTASCFIFDCSPSSNWLFNHFQPLAMRVYRLVMGHWWLTGSTFGIMRSAYDQAGGFDPNCRDLEDIEFGWRVTAVGPIRYVPPRRIVVTTNGDRFRHGLLRGAWPYARAFFGRFWFRQGDRFARHD
jgi:glycosyltransferase involved in cell wall biosynthesis